MQNPPFRHICWLLIVAMCPLAAPAAEATIESVRVGFDGTYKVGHWTPVWVTLAGGTESIRGELSIQVADCDGIQTRFTAAAPIQLAAGEKLTVSRCIKFGRRGDNLSVELAGHEGLVTQRVFKSGEFPIAHLSSERMIVTVGGSVGTSDVIQELPGDRPVAWAEVPSLAHLPEHWCGYEGVDTVVVLTSQTAALDGLTPERFRALDQWLHLGGRIVLCVGANGKQFFQDGEPWAGWNPGEFAGVFQQTGVAGIEAFVGSSRRLDPFAMTLLEQVRGGIEARTGSGREYPAVVRTFRGFGQLVTVTCDLDQPPFSSWPDRAALVAKILNPSADRSSNSIDNHRTAQVLHVGYDDLVGQLRGALDRFGGVTRVAFAPIAALIAVYALLVGPGDYFLIRYLGRRMHWSWLSFAFQVLAFCGLAFFLFGQLRERRLQINQVDLVDVDLASGWTRGTTWAHLYSPATETYDLSLRPLPLGDTGPSAPILSWQGLPGSGLGGLNSNTSTGLFDAPFDAPYFIGSDSDQAGESAVSIGSLPVPIGSTKSLTARWSARTQGSEIRLTANANDLLDGEVRNPLSVDLTSPLLIYSNWVYPFQDGVFKAGQVMPIRRLDPKNLTWRLQRRRVVEMRDFGTPWDPADVLDLPRILEMMMFYEAAGGKSYTRLSHDYQSYVDLTDHIRADRAVLLGRCDAPASELTRAGGSLAGNYDQRSTYVRIVFPVDRSEAPARRRP